MLLVTCIFLTNRDPKFHGTKVNRDPKFHGTKADQAASVILFISVLSIVTSEAFVEMSIWIVLMQGSVILVGALPDLDDFFWEKDPTPLLDMVETPMHLKNLSHKVFTLTMLKYIVGRSP